MDIKPANRISDIKPYFFAALAKDINTVKNSGLDVIRLDMGSPDLPPADFIVEALEEAARMPSMHGYTQPGGSLSFRKAIAGYYQRKFNVELDYDREVIGLIGSKEGIYNLNQILINPGDYVIIPDPGYPVYTEGAIIAGGLIHHVPLLAENNYLPDLDRIPADICQKAKILWLNYPNNPTGAVAPLEYFSKVVAFAQKHNILIAHDAPYVDVCFDGYQAPSILEVPGAKDVAIEFNSLSKTYNMAGWRLGMACGNSEVIRLLGVIKSQMDSSIFGPLMFAGEVAMNSDQSWLEQRNLVYHERRDLTVDALRAAGFTLETPKASLYVWAKVPGEGVDCIDFCHRLLMETGVSITPGIVYGKSGAGYIRISLVTPTERMKLAYDRLSAWMAAQ